MTLSSSRSDRPSWRRSSLAPAAASAALKVVTTTSDLASLAGEVGGDGSASSLSPRATRIRTSSRPSRASSSSSTAPTCLIAVGRELEIGWLPPLHRRRPATRRSSPAAAGYLDASLAARILEIPTGPDHARDGRRPSLGQPALLARSRQRPARSRRAIAAQARRAAIRPNAAYFAATRGGLRADASTPPRSDGRRRWRPTAALKVVTYHRSWPQLRRPLRARRHRLRRAQARDPALARAHHRPHAGDARAEGEGHPRGAVLRRARRPNSIARETGARVLVMPPSVGGVPEATDYIALFDYDVKLLVDALETTGSK